MTDHTSDLLRRIEQAGSRIDAGLTDRDVERLIHATERRSRRRGTTARAGLAIAAFAVTGFLVVRVLPSLSSSRPSQPPSPSIGLASPARRGMSGQTAPPGAAPVPAADAERAPLVRLRDGSSVAALDAGSILATVEDSPRHSLIDLQRGRARFDVIPSRTHAFSVRAGGVTITVMGTVFTVERIADRVGVNVERGTVRVNWGLGGKVLRAGESNWFPPLVVESRSDAASKPSATSRSQDRPPAEVVPTLALSHTDVAAAPAVAGGTTAPRQDARPIMRTDSVGDLLAAADIARMDGRAKDGVLILQSVLRDHGADPRAPLAAFTLGRVLMMELGQPREAATAFARTRSLAPGGAFAEDALARETEAWVKAGEPSFARAKALEYLRTYPQGRRVDSVKALGGID